jgi:hypothetical protein
MVVWNTLTAATCCCYRRVYFSFVISRSEVSKTGEAKRAEDGRTVHFRVETSVCKLCTRNLFSTAPNVRARLARECVFLAPQNCLALKLMFNVATDDGRTQIHRTASRKDLGHVEDTVNIKQQAGRRSDSRLAVDIIVSLTREEAHPILTLFNKVP